MIMILLEFSQIMKKSINYILDLITDQPRGLYVLLYTEICELFGMFSITALLVLYMTHSLKTSDHLAFFAYGSFTALVYAIPLLGGYLSDRIFGFKQVIYFSILLMALGEIILVFHSIRYFYFGLAIFSVGCGFFTPAITAVLGKLYAHHDEKRDSAFTMYYIAKNIGALFATIICSLVAAKYGYKYAFMVGSIVVISGYVTFFIGSHRLSSCFSIPTNIMPFFSAVLLLACFFLIFIMADLVLSKNISNIFIASILIISFFLLLNLYIKFDKKDRKKLIIIVFSVLMMIIFSMMLGQGGTTLSLFIDRITDRNIDGLTVPTSMFYALDPFFMVIFGGAVMFFLDKIVRPTKTIESFVKIGFGLSSLGVGFLIFFIAATSVILFNEKSSVFYIVAAYALFPIAELCIMPIVISLITRISPKGYEGLMVGFYLFGNAVANYFTGIFSKIGSISYQVNAHTIVSASKVYQKTFFISALLLFTSSFIIWLAIYKLKLRTYGALLREEA